jgi:hypothetical protein
MLTSNNPINQNYSYLTNLKTSHVNNKLKQQQLGIGQSQTPINKAKSISC